MTSTQRPKAERDRAALNHFRACARKMQPTKHHRPVLWENMLGTVYACNAAGEVRYFDYDYELAVLHVGACTDVRVARLRQARCADQLGEHVIPTGKLAWFARFDQER